MPKTKYPIFLLIALFLACTASGPDIAGTTTETNTSAAIQGHINRQDGTPVSNAQIMLHYQQTVTASLGKILTPIREGTAQSNGDGFFRFDSVYAGNYLLEVLAPDSSGVMLKVKVGSGDTLIDVTGMAEQLGAIVGEADTSDIPHPESLTIRLLEIGRTVNLNRDGSFAIRDLPVWNYQLRASAGDTLVGLVTDSTFISVIAGGVTHVNIRAKKGKN
jgi:hypothetical protein